MLKLHKSVGVWSLNTSLDTVVEPYLKLNEGIICGLDWKLSRSLGTVNLSGLSNFKIH